MESMPESRVTARLINASGVFVCIVVLEQADFTELHELLVFFLVTQISVCCSSVTLDLEPIEHPCTVTHHPTHQLVSCYNVNLLLFRIGLPSAAHVPSLMYFGHISVRF